MTPDAHHPTPVAALYVMENTIYRSIPGVQIWPRSRNANLYPGPFPVVAHPPCSAWSRLWNCNKSRKRPGHGDTTGLRAVELVRRFGGILEQPARSQLWLAAYLPEPGGPDLWGGETIQVNQSGWGHVATKPTWLYLCRTARFPDPPYPDRPGKLLQNCSRKQKFTTPVAFARALVATARTAVPLEPP